MTTISSLPKELLFNIFNKLDKLAHLAECRLVCKAWSKPVERAMLGNTITIDSRNEAKMHSLYAFLQIDPARAYLIKHLDFFLPDYSRSTITNELLQLALSSNNIESITGSVGEANFLTGIVEKSPNKFDKLKTLAVSCAGNPPSKLALHCRETIQTIDLDFYFTNYRIDWCFMDKLNEFHHLTSFTLIANVGGIRNLDRILDGCPHLREFVLMEPHKFFPLKNDGKLNLQDIKRHINMRAFRISIDFTFDDMTQYLLYKFISVEKIDIRFNHGFGIFGDIVHRLEQERWDSLKFKEADVQEILLSLNRTNCIAKVQANDSHRNTSIKILHK